MTITAPTPSSAPALLPSRAQHNRVVVGVDDHPVSIAALRFAATEAGYRGGAVLAVHVWHHPYTSGLPTDWPEEADLGPIILTELQATVDATLADRAAAGEKAVPITAEVVEGDAAAVLNAAATGAALLVLGARHHNRLLGSVSQACTSHPSCPIVVVPGESPPA